MTHDSVRYARTLSGEKWDCLDCNVAMPVTDADENGYVVECPDCKTELRLKKRVGTFDEVTLCIVK